MSGGFAGFVNYSANFLYDKSFILDCLWAMADELGSGVKCGIDVLEETGAFIQNSTVPIKGTDYFRRTGENVYYLFNKGLTRPAELADRIIKNGLRALRSTVLPYSCAFYVPQDKSLYLYRSPGANPLYYAQNASLGLVFGTSWRVLNVCDGSDQRFELEPDRMVTYSFKGLVL